MDEIKFYAKKRIPLEDGDIFHFLDFKDKNFCGFGEVYFSSIRYNSIKGWKKHNLMTMNLICLIGKVQFIFAAQDESKKWIFSEFILDPLNNGVLNVPPGYFFCFKGLGKDYNLISNFSNLLHDESEITRLSIESIPYKW